MSIINKIAVICFLALLPLGITAQDKLPVPAKPSAWVNDYAGIFSSEQANALNQKLNEFEYNNSTQIFVVTVSDNGGYPVADLATRIGEAWGIGQKGKDNGLLILVDMQDRDFQIATGYGLEEFVPDAIAKRVALNEITPAFKNGDYYGGIDAATGVLISLLDGEFTPEQYRKQTSSGGSSIGGLIFMIFLFSMLFGGRRRSSGVGGRRSNLPLWMALGMMSGGRSSGSFGNFSGGSGGFGGFSGGGGGSFGGGGAGGSW